MCETNLLAVFEKMFIKNFLFIYYIIMLFSFTKKFFLFIYYSALMI